MQISRSNRLRRTETAVTIAKIRGRARGAGSELALACDMRFAARENAILGQIEVGVGALPGAGGVQHLGRLLGRGRAMEAILGADDFAAETAERYGSSPEAYLDVFFTRSAESRQAGTEALRRMYAWTEDRDTATTWATREAQYDAVCTWGIPDHALLQRLSCLQMPVFVANGDSDR